MKPTPGTLVVAVWLLFDTSASSVAQSPPRPSSQSMPQPQSRAQLARGELLYSTHCIACHTAQMHWRANKRVVDWASLQAEVRRWAANAGAGWSDEEIVDVARYLNSTIYRFPAAAGRELGARGQPSKT